MNTIILQLQITKHTDDTITIDSYKYIPIYMYDKGAGQEKRYKILDINKTIEGYKKGQKGISDTVYNKVTAAKDMIDKTLKGE